MDTSASWHHLKTKLRLCSNRELLGLIHELYDLNKDNQRFLNARFMYTGPQEKRLMPYKILIRRGVCPEPFKPLQLASARKAVSDYKKATGDVVGTLELMLYYVVCGTEFSLLYGDIEESFYCSLESMFAAAIKLLKRSDPSLRAQYVPRLHELVHQARELGWGYADTLAGLLAAGWLAQVSVATRDYQGSSATD